MLYESCSYIILFHNIYHVNWKTTVFTGGHLCHIYICMPFAEFWETTGISVTSKKTLLKEPQVQVFCKWQKFKLTKTIHPKTDVILQMCVYVFSHSRHPFLATTTKQSFKKKMELLAAKEQFILSQEFVEIKTELKSSELK